MISVEDLTKRRGGRAAHVRRSATRGGEAWVAERFPK